MRLAREGKRVVRLKGGDPFVFGRGGEELEACRAAGVSCEVVPGVTAALACAAATGIPLTHRDHARTVTFATGHTRDGRLDLDFAALARPGQTLAIYMGVTTLAALRDGLVAAGLPAATPAALVERGGTDRQRVLRGTLAGVVAEAPAWHAGGPALLLVGEVAAAETAAATGEEARLAGVKVRQAEARALPDASGGRSPGSALHESGVGLPGSRLAAKRVELLLARRRDRGVAPIRRHGLQQPPPQRRRHGRVQLHMPQRFAQAHRAAAGQGIDHPHHHPPDRRKDLEEERPRIGNQAGPARRPR